jgi:hypothetical protein
MEQNGIELILILPEESTIIGEVTIGVRAPDLIQWLLATTKPVFRAPIGLVPVQDVL